VGWHSSQVSVPLPSPMLGPHVPPQSRNAKCEELRLELDAKRRETAQFACGSAREALKLRQYIAVSGARLAPCDSREPAWRPGLLTARGKRRHLSLSLAALPVVTLDKQKTKATTDGGAQADPAASSAKQ
jgi:hypothetical protein